MKKKLAVLALAGIMAGSLAACGSSSSATSTGSSSAESVSTEAGSSADASSSSSNISAESDITITVVLKTLSAEYWQYVGKGCNQAGTDLGINVSVVGATSETAYDEQLNMLETVLAAGESDAVVVAPLQSDAVATQIANADIPIVAIDTMVESDKVVSFVGFNNEDIGAIGGAAAVEKAKEAGWEEIKAIGIAGVQGDSTSEARMAGYKTSIEENGGIFLEDEIQYADSVADKAVTAMEGIMQTHPEGIAIIVCNGDDMACGAARAAADNKAYANTIFVGCGGNMNGLEAVASGLETMTVAVDGYEVGYKGVETAYKAVIGEDYDEVVYTSATVVDESNVEDQMAIVEKKQNS